MSKFCVYNYVNIILIHPKVSALFELARKIWLRICGLHNRFGGIWKILIIAVYKGINECESRMSINNNKQFLLNQLVWLGISFGISLTIFILLPFPLSL